ncbi:hypothetical protein Tmar_0281 [Thermaerobacter marianensis DSM 12885]|uniref:CopG domain protein DNA-binding domain protein n=1 Tax=Thermaerobacter marianensis (strain ATCC 700841 / DSM 12885 / JCM 10246 / 7p75a) TaxID=644966 RepID=E6SME6_THEM7|nr:YlcI/YnfO family protein [Thermaerobacter marianensis]ADU50406.1 hypothetical protein Tmar_0281 [Thermaerobacter marianensis DSM 12885]
MAEGRHPLTVRVPAELLAGIRQVQEPGESLNDFLVAAARREITRRQALRARDTIVRLRQAIRERTGVHPDPIPLIRALREGEARDE